MSRGSSVSTVSGWGLGDRGSIPGRGKRIFPLASVSRPALGPTQPPIQWLPGVLSPAVKRGRVVMLTTHHNLLPMSWMSRSYTFPLCATIDMLWDCFTFNSYLFTVFYPCHNSPLLHVRLIRYCDQFYCNICTVHPPYIGHSPQTVLAQFSETVLRH
jgi:hypothetical protein